MTFTFENVCIEEADKEIRNLNERKAAQKNYIPV